VRDAAQRARVEHLFREACAGVRWELRDWFASAVSGGDGNTEYFAWAQAPAPEIA
jgi:23S rRNA (cytidine1920-2'-O)/16S rRNA (cytidine1409-2'-O)-methyltransferase